MNGVEFILSVVAGILATVVCTGIKQMIDKGLMGEHPYTLMLLQLIVPLTTMFVCSMFYRWVNRFLDKHSSDNREVAKELRRKVYLLVTMLLYTGVVVIAVDSFIEVLTVHRGIFLELGTEVGVLTGEVKVFLMWVLGFTVAIMQGLYLYGSLKEGRGLLEHLKGKSRSEALGGYIGLLLMFLVTYI